MRFQTTMYLTMPHLPPGDEQRPSPSDRASPWTSRSMVFSTGAFDAGIDDALPETLDGLAALHDRSAGRERPPLLRTRLPPGQRPLWRPLP